VFLTQLGEWEQEEGRGPTRPRPFADILLLSFSREFRSLLEPPDSTPRKHSATEEDIRVKRGFAGTKHYFRHADRALQLPVRN
jgi:hypothetical protein